MRFNPELPDAHNNLGVAYGRKGLIKLAIEEFITTLRLEPDNAYAHFNLASAYMENGLRKKAIRELKETIRLRPDYTKARKILERLTTEPQH